MDATRADAVRLARELRREFAVELDVEAKGFSAQMKTAGKSGARVALILGEDEWKRGEVGIKNLGSGEQKTIQREAIAAELRRAIEEIGRT
jgi:histidyl-tRNA synthetase